MFSIFVTAFILRGIYDLFSKESQLFTYFSNTLESFALVAFLTIILSFLFFIVLRLWSIQISQNGIVGRSVFGFRRSFQWEDIQDCYMESDIGISAIRVESKNHSIVFPTLGLNLTTMELAIQSAYGGKHKAFTSLFDHLDECMD